MVPMAPSMMRMRSSRSLRICALLSGNMALPLPIRCKPGRFVSADMAHSSTPKRGFLAAGAAGFGTGDPVAPGNGRRRNPRSGPVGGLGVVCMAVDPDLEAEVNHWFPEQITGCAGCYLWRIAM